MSAQLAFSSEYMAPRIRTREGSWFSLMTPLRVAKAAAKSTSQAHQHGKPLVDKESKNVRMIRQGENTNENHRACDDRGKSVEEITARPCGQTAPRHGALTELQSFG